MRISDLKKIFRNAYSDYSTLANGVRLYQLSTGITAGVTTTTAPDGSFGLTSHATGKKSLFVSDGAFWQVAWGTLEVATSAVNLEVAAGMCGGTYTLRGTNNGYPYWNLDGETSDPAGKAIVVLDDAGLYWFIDTDNSHRRYKSVETADNYASVLDVVWEIGPGTGTSPLPTLTADYFGRFTLSSAPLGFKVKDVDTGFTYELIDPDNYDSEAGWKVEPKVYRALMTQASTAAPVPTVLQNTLGGVPTWSRTDVGRSDAELIGFNGTNTVPYRTALFNDGAGAFDGLSVTAGGVNRVGTIYTASHSDLTAGADDILGNTYIEFVVYP